MLRFAVFLVLVLAEQADAQCPAGVDVIVKQRCVSLGTKEVHSYFEAMQECFSMEKGQLLHSFEDFDAIKEFINDNKVADIDGFVMGYVKQTDGLYVYHMYKPDQEVETFYAAGALQDVIKDIRYRPASQPQHTAIFTKYPDQQAVVSMEALLDLGQRLSYICEHEYNKE